MVKKVESSVLEMSSADIGTSDKLEEESEKEKLPEMAELLQREKDSLVTRISKMEMENEKLKKRLKKKEVSHTNTKRRGRQVESIIFSFRA